VWPTDDPTGTHPSDRADDDHDPACDYEYCGGECLRMDLADDIDRANLDAATRADERQDEDDTDYDGPEWPF
jgi:hypothetical protein